VAHARYLHVDVFTSQRLAGNQLAVYDDGRGIDPVTMQAIALEMNFSETTFVLPRERDNTDARVRIFTPRTELPLAGHPVIGTAFALAHSGAIPPGTGTFVMELGVGPTAVTLEWNGGRLRFAWMQQPVPVTGAELKARDRVAAALGVSVRDLVPDLPVQVVSSGTPYLFVPLATRAAVDASWLDGKSLASVFADAGEEETPAYVFSTEPHGDGATTYSRMFAPSFGIAEDPATGGACGPLGAYLVQHGLVVPERAHAIVNKQGFCMGRPSVIHIKVECAGNRVRDVRVGGEAVVVGEGTLHFD